MNLKYRIKEVVDGNGNHWYYPQIKKWFGWSTLEEVHYDSGLEEYYTPYKLDKKSKAKEIIDRDYTIRMSEIIKEVNYSDYIPISVELNNIFKNFGK